MDPADPPRLVARKRICRFPDALAPLPGGGALVACRFEPGLWRIERDGSRGWRTRVLDAGPESGARGLALAPGGALAYVASPAVGGVKVVSLAGGGVVQTVPTGLGPRALRVVPGGRLPGRSEALLLVSNFIDHVVTVHPIAPDGRLGEPLQAIRTEAPVLDLLVAGEAEHGAAAVHARGSPAVARERTGRGARQRRGPARRGTGRHLRRSGARGTARSPTSGSASARSSSSRRRRERDGRWRSSAREPTTCSSPTTTDRSPRGRPSTWARTPRRWRRFRRGGS